MFRMQPGPLHLNLLFILYCCHRVILYTLFGLTVLFFEGAPNVCLMSYDDNLLLLNLKFILGMFFVKGLEM